MHTSYTSFNTYPRVCMNAMAREQMNIDKLRRVSRADMRVPRGFGAGLSYLFNVKYLEYRTI